MISVCSLSQTRRTAPSGYSNVPFNASVEKLPALYRGADPVALYNALVQRRKRSAKGEFETSERYRQRIQREEGTPLLGHIGLNSVMAFEIPDLETSFDADAQTLLAVISLGYPKIGVGPALDKRSLELKFKPDPTTTYVGSNAFGVKVVVKRQRSSSYGLLLENFVRVENGPPPRSAERNTTGPTAGLTKIRARKGDTITKIAAAQKTSADDLARLNGIAPDAELEAGQEIKIALGRWGSKTIWAKLRTDVSTAKHLKGSLRALVIVQLVPPYVEAGFLTSEPTIDDPTELFTVYEYLHVKVLEVWFYDVSNERVIEKQ